MNDGSPPIDPNQVDLPDDAQAFAAAMQQMSLEIRGLGLANQVRTFSGEGTRKFKDWQKDMTRICTAIAANPDRTRSLALQTTSGFAADFLTRFLKENPTADWPKIKQAMSGRYSDDSDASYALQKMRRLRQSSGESVQNFAERILSLAEDAFDEDEMNDRLVQKEMIDTLIDGVKSDVISKKLLKHSPDTFTDALQVALDEQQTTRSFQLRRRTEEPMEVDMVHAQSAKLNNLEEKMSVLTETVATLAGKLSEVFITQATAAAPAPSYSTPSAPVYGQKRPYHDSHPKPVQPKKAYRWTADGKPICYFCNKIGHKMLECRMRKAELNKRGQLN